MQEKEYYIFMAHETLTKYGLKRTKSRIAILGVLSKASLPMTAEDIFYGLKTKDINLSTVYRTLNSFVEAGLAELLSYSMGLVFKSLDFLSAVAAAILKNLVPYLQILTNFSMSLTS